MQSCTKLYEAAASCGKLREQCINAPGVYDWNTAYKGDRRKDCTYTISDVLCRGSRRESGLGDKVVEPW